MIHLTSFFIDFIYKSTHGLIKTIQVYNLFLDLWNRLIILRGWGVGAKLNGCFLGKTSLEKNLKLHFRGEEVRGAGGASKYHKALLPH